MPQIRALCVFCGSSRGARPEYLAAAHEVGGLLADRGIHLVYGGGNVGLMGAVADAALAAGGEVTGVIPEDLVTWEVAHTRLTRLVVVRTMHERKALMADLSDATLALPGGFGTLDELCEALTWSQLGIQGRPIGLLNVAGFFDPLLTLFEHAVSEGFVRPQHQALAITDEDPRRLLGRLTDWQAPETLRWIDRTSR